jgi:very-short-patch-repair endonuclease
MTQDIVTWEISLIKIIQETCTVDKIVTRKKLIEFIPRIIQETNSIGKTPTQTMSRILQELRNQQLIVFKSKGSYELVANDEQIAKYIKFIQKSTMSKGERCVAVTLKDLKIEYTREKTFKDLKFKGFLRFDFYFVIGENRYCIEFDGKQHFEEVKFFYRTADAFKMRKNLDKIKDDYCGTNGIKLLRIAYNDIKDCAEKIKTFVK